MNEVKVQCSDPFDFPPSIVPAGLKYQWVTYTVLGKVADGYRDMADRGWREVPAAWHPGVFEHRCVAFPGGWIEYGGQRLMCHPNPRDEEAERIAGAQKNIDDWAKKSGAQFSGGVRTWTGPAGAPPPKTAPVLTVGNPKIAEAIMKRPMPAAPRPALIGNLHGVPIDAPLAAKCDRAHRVPRHPWLRWLFDFISTEAS